MFASRHDVRRRQRWITTVGLIGLGVVCITAVFLEAAAATHTHSGATAGPGLIAGFIAALDIVLLAVLRPWSYGRDDSLRAWAALIAMIAIALLGLRLFAHAGPELRPLVWFMGSGAFICGALIASAVAADVRQLWHQRQRQPTARIVSER